MKYAIAAGHNATADTAETILKNGGNAIDAAIAAYLTTFIAEPCMASGGGGAFANVRLADGRMILFDFFCQTPKFKRPASELEFIPVEVDFGTTTEVFYTGRGSIGVPGSIAGIFAMHEHLGVMPLQELIQIPVSYAKNGALIDDFQAIDIALLQEILRANEHGRSLFFKDGKVRQAGDYIKMPAFADFLEVLAIEGSDLFYKGEIAQQIVKDQREGGYLTMADFEDYRVDIRQPLQFNYRDKVVFTNPLPSIGGSLIAHYLDAFEGINFGADAFDNTHLLNLYQAFHQCENIDRRPRALQQSLANLRRNKKHGSTTHFNIVDQAGNAVSLTATAGEGSGIFVEGTDIQLNNMLGEAALMPNGFHSWDTEVRLSSMMAPTIMTNIAGELELVTGTGGAGRIPSAIAQVIHHIIDYNLPLETAVNAPRVHLAQGNFNVEPGFDHNLHDSSIEANLKLWKAQSLYFGGVHSIQVKNGKLLASGDDRRDGVTRSLG